MNAGLVSTVRSFAAMKVYLATQRQMEPTRRSCRFYIPTGFKGQGEYVCGGAGGTMCALVLAAVVKTGDRQCTKPSFKACKA